MGSSSNPLYFVLANPTSFPTGTFGNLALTYVALAAASGGATAASTAFTNTWNLFSSGGSPANVTTWSNAQLQYYPNGFSGNCALNPWLLLTTASGGGECGGFAYLLEAELWLNNVTYHTTKVTAIDNSQIVINNWNFQSVKPSGIGNWPFALMLVQESNGFFGMFPAPAGYKYGDVTSQSSGLPGQGVNSNTLPVPTEKVFLDH